jgi:hypothetical protein
MKNLLIILFLLISVSVFSQVRTNVFRVAGDSTIISTSSVVPSSLIIDAESNKEYITEIFGVDMANHKKFEIKND